MIAYLLVDTDVASFCFRGDSRAEAYRPFLEGQVLVLSFMSVAELRYWTRVRNRGKRRRDQLEEYVHRFLIYLYENAICDTWADVTFKAYKKGRAISCADAWVAATAMLHDLPLVTHNRRDFEFLDDLELVQT